MWFVGLKPKLAPNAKSMLCFSNAQGSPLAWQILQSMFRAIAYEGSALGILKHISWHGSTCIWCIPCS